MAIKKKGTADGKPTHATAGTLPETSSHGQGRSSPTHPGEKKPTPKELIHELQVHQAELEAQAEELRHAQLALAESRDQYLDLYEFAPLGYLALTDTALVSRANLNAALLLGIDRSKMNGARFRKWIVQKDLETWDTYFLKLLHSETKHTITLSLKREDGTTFPARLESIRLGGATGQSIRVAISDISDIRMAEKELRESEDKLRETKDYLDNLITYTSGPIIVWDPEFRIILFNKAFEHLTGRMAKDVTGKKLDILLPDTYLASVMDLIRKATEGERWESVEIPILHKNGGIRTVLWNSNAIYGSDGKTIVSTIAQGQDITDRKKRETEYRQKAIEFEKINVILHEEIKQRKTGDATLKKTLSLLNASLESTADGILVVDCQGRITNYNQNFVSMWSVPLDLLKSGESERFTLHAQPQLKNPGEFLERTEELLRHPGRESFDMIEFCDGKIFERYSKPQLIGESVVGRVLSFRDITDRKHAEEKLVASIEEKEVLLREIHHRVKNNLQLISGLLDMTRMRTADESTNSILTDMMLKIQTMAQIHTRLYESRQFGKINLTAQIQDQVASLSNIYSHKGHEIACEIDPNEVFLPVDQAIPCALVVNEILSNAYKHAFEGRKQGGIKISAVLTNGRIRITVRDNGIGLPENFDMSRTSSLGMKLIHTLVQHQLRGTLSFKSGKGTEIIIEFPVLIVEK